MTDKEFQKLIKEALKFYNPKAPEIPERVLNFDGGRISQIYLKAYKEVMMLLLNNLSINGNLTDVNNMTLLSIMAQVDEILNGADATITKEIASELEKEYVSGQLNHYISSEQNFSAVDIAKNFPLAKLNTHKVNQIVGDTMEDLLFATGNTRKSIKKLVQNTVSKHIQLGAIKGENYDEIKKQISKELTRNGLSKTIKEEGFVGIIDKGGRKWNVNTYADMVVQTKMHQAYTEGLKDRALETGKDLAKIPHKGAKDPCKNFEGMIISLTGATKDFPTYDQLKATGLIFHPKCRHSPVPIGRIEILPDEDLAEHFKRMEELQELNGKKPKKKTKEDQDKKIQELKQRLKDKYGNDLKKDPKEIKIDADEIKEVSAEPKEKIPKISDPKYLEKKYGIKINVDDDIKHLFDFIPKKHFETVNKHIDDIFKRYPKLTENQNSVLNAINYTTMRRGVGGSYGNVRNDIQINLHRLQMDYEYALEENIPFKYDIKEHGTTIQQLTHTVIHEFGHYLDNMISRKKAISPERLHEIETDSEGDVVFKYTTTVFDEFGEKKLKGLMKKKGWKMGKREIDRELGDYATTDFGELLSEGWAFSNLEISEDLLNTFSSRERALEYYRHYYSKMADDVKDIVEEQLEKYFK